MNSMHLSLFFQIAFTEYLSGILCMSDVLGDNYTVPVC